MKIIYRTGNALDGPEPVFVHGCNAQGKMRSGVAKEVRERFPVAYTEYMRVFNESGLTLGSVIWADAGTKMLVNGITQEYYGYDSRQYVSYEAVADVMEAINTAVASMGPEPVEVSMPLIGAKRGGGRWPTIAEIIEAKSTSFQPVVYTLDGTIPE